MEEPPLNAHQRKQVFRAKALGQLFNEDPQDDDVENGHVTTDVKNDFTNESTTLPAAQDFSSPQQERVYGVCPPPEGYVPGTHQHRIEGEHKASSPHSSTSDSEEEVTSRPRRRRKRKSRVPSSQDMQDGSSKTPAKCSRTEPKLSKNQKRKLKKKRRKERLKEEGNQKGASFVYDKGKPDAIGANQEEHSSYMDLSSQKQEIREFIDGVLDVYRREASQSADVTSRDSSSSRGSIHSRLRSQEAVLDKLHSFLEEVTSESSVQPLVKVKSMVSYNCERGALEAVDTFCESSTCDTDIKDLLRTLIRYWFTHVMSRS